MTRIGALAIRVLSAFALPLLGSACGPDKPPPKAADPDPGVYWQDVFDGTPEVLFFARPAALKRDATYGELARSAFRAAVARGVSTELSQMQALEDADEVIMGAGARSGGGVLVVRGVRADLDPAKVSDGRAPLWILAKPGKVREYSGTDRASNAALYALPNRTWVVVHGAARDRARVAFTTPQKRPEPIVDKTALVSVRIDGPSLVQQVPGLTRGRLAKVGNKLSALTLLVRPDKQGVDVRMEYADDESTAWSERSTEDILEILRNDKRHRWDFLKDAKVKREPTAVVVHVALPPNLLEALPRASGAEVDPQGFPAGP